MRINQATVDLVKEFEGLELHAYRDPVSVVTIGYGYTNNAGFGPGVEMGDVWTEEQAENMLWKGLEVFAAEITPLFKRKPTDNQFGAMLSLAYNIGTGAFARSTCLKRFNAGDDEGAAEALTWFNKAGGKVLRGLVRRREAERALFLTDSPVSINDGSAARPDKEKEMTSSTTLGAGFVAFLAMLGQVMDGVKRVVDQIAGAFGLSPEAALAIIAIAGIGWMCRERIMKKLRFGV